MNKYEALETMLENIFEHGADIENSLAEFPEFEEELRPLIESAMDASALAAPPAPGDVARRGRTRFLAQAAKMRDAAPASRASFFDFRFATVALTLLLVFFVGGTGIVQASASALPGDGLYVVKRGWEDVSLRFADKDELLNLEAKYKEERREEVDELLGRRRLEIVRFEGIVTSLNGIRWEVAGVPVILSEETIVETLIRARDEVIVRGRTHSDGVVLASEITLVSQGIPTSVDEVKSIETESPREKYEVIGTPKLDGIDDNKPPNYKPEPDDDGGDDNDRTHASDSDDGDDDDDDDDDDDNDGEDDDGDDDDDD